MKESILKDILRPGYLCVQMIRSVFIYAIYIPFAAGIEIKQPRIWFYKFITVSFKYSMASLLREFVKAEICCTKEYSLKKTTPEIIVICVVRNDLERVKIFLEHHRTLGIQHFAFFDDQSNDGTKEFLAMQDDVALFEDKQRFTSLRKVAWINRITAYYGLNQWYLVLDSDELLIYDNCENNNIFYFLQYLKNNNISACSGIMLDMYSSDTLMPAHTDTSENIYAKLNYFDKTGYYFNHRKKNQPCIVYGGFRYRYFRTGGLLCKTPLFYLDKQAVYTTPHNVFPIKKNFEMINGLVLLHYKFLPHDYNNYNERVKDKNMYGKSREYRQYIDVWNTKKEFCFYDKDVSEKYENSQTLIKYNFIKHLNGHGQAHNPPWMADCEPRKG
ncbi:MAG: glycosyltransferase family 2 protein [Spirochaetaceae bacterium]|jgi:hypothetical protein|nr:glycosyltransferase family 2 protein [Spirochaetaceae bacterium]